MNIEPDRQSDILVSWSEPKYPGGQQEGEHGVVHHVQEEHYQRMVLRVLVIVSGPVGPESSRVCSRSSLKKSQDHKPKSKLQNPGLFHVEYK